MEEAILEFKAGRCEVVIVPALVLVVELSGHVEAAT